jgi:hypothetical protein
MSHEIEFDESIVGPCIRFFDRSVWAATYSGIPFLIESADGFHLRPLSLMSHLWPRDPTEFEAGILGDNSVNGHCDFFFGNIYKGVTWVGEAHSSYPSP